MLPLSCKRKTERGVNSPQPIVRLDNAVAEFSSRCSPVFPNDLAKLEAVQTTPGTASAPTEFPGQRVSKPTPLRIQLRPQSGKVSVHLVSTSLGRPENDTILKDIVFPYSVRSVELIA